MYDLIVGDALVWYSKDGLIKAEFRGRHLGANGPEVCIIARPVGEKPFQITVPLSEIRRDVDENPEIKLEVMPWITRSWRKN
jgi:hypothetical protein